MSAFLFFATRLSDGSAPPASRCRGPPTAPPGVPSILAGHGGSEKTLPVDHEVDRAVNLCESCGTVADTNPTSNRVRWPGRRRGHPATGAEGTRTSMYRGGAPAVEASTA